MHPSKKISEVVYTIEGNSDLYDFVNSWVTHSPKRGLLRQFKRLSKT